ncbi:MAG: hypothetical protein NVSMB2_26710 [Chloroflexota bacterium]
MLLTSGPEPLDPALLAFIKCHVTSPVRWEVLRLLACHNGEWLSSEQLAHGAHVRATELTTTLADLVNDGLVERRAPTPAAPVAAYSLPADEPTSIVLRRLIQTATHSLELRAIIAAYMQRTRREIKPIPPLAPLNPMPSSAVG